MKLVGERAAAKFRALMAPAPPVGTDADAPWEIPPRGWWQALKRCRHEAMTDNLALIAAGVAFYGFLALVPLLGALVLTYGILVDPVDAARHIRELTRLVPADAARLIADQLENIVRTSAGKKGLGLLLALGLSLYGAMKGAEAMITALNIVYEEREKRGLVQLVVLQAQMTVAAVGVAILMLSAATLSAALEAWAGGFAAVAVTGAKLFGWLLAASISSAAIAALYRVAPSRHVARWQWVAPGAVLATFAMVATSGGFGWYAANLGSYNTTYGSLGAVVVLMLWLWLSAYGLLLGGELNAELERQTERDTTTGPELPMGQRGARMADLAAPAG
ncbi:YihY/virulence factor BrkB family protein [Sandaracinobacteroides hominis]|uniref:YihY/virulence factor BrkB family protein n=1 Tax=Sandaracinobacteroides hominis TaxID=2780086 RepID=UPI002E2D9107|nr:YihY/virulence factor BrkB family protein [Sandaracinobacteroides hominis]